MGFRSNEAFAWTNLGHALLGLGQPDEAAEAYRAALQIRLDLGEMPLVTEDWAGLARVALAAGDVEQAWAYATKIASGLEGGGHLDGAEEPFPVYLTWYRVLRAAGEPRAEEVITTAHTLLQEQAARIPDPALRRSFLENVPWHREVVEAHQSVHG